MLSINHAYTSTKGDPTDSSLIGATKWNASHLITGLTFVDDETPAGLIDGTNDTFTLAFAPNPASSLQLFRNGIRQDPVADYTLASNVVTISSLLTGDSFKVTYRY